MPDQEVLPPDSDPTVTTMVRRPATVPVAMSAELTVGELAGQVTKIQQAMSAVMKADVHYGTIPGTPKPTLFKPGAEKLCLLFRLAPSYEVHETYDGDHYTVRATCTLIHGPSGNLVATGEGLCTTKEKRYAMRKGGHVCPSCGKQDTVIKGKEEYGGGWLCFVKKGGCNAKWSDDSTQGQEFASAVIEDIPNPDLPDLYNTVLKMACKRALVAAVLNGTAASDIFTQDVEDLPSSAAPRATASAAPHPGASGAPAGAEPQVVQGSPETLAALKAEITRLGTDQPDIWGEAAVVANCTRQFGRKIEKLEQLTEREMNDILKAAADWTTFTYDSGGN